MSLFIVGTAFAEETAPPDSPRQRAFDLQDEDGDESLSPEEYAAGSLGQAAQNKREEFQEWDLDGDGALSFEEFRKRGNRRPPPRDFEREFKRRDRDFDGALTLEELLSTRGGVPKREAKGSFYTRDVDDDGLLTLEEFSGAGAPLSTDERFYHSDVDENGSLSEEEFLAPAEGKSWYEAARRNFRQYDLDGDGSLALREFRLTPGQNPDAETLFYGRDADLDGRLSPEELIRWMSGPDARRATATFDQYDLNGDGGLSLPEYEARESALEAEGRFRYWTGLLETWGTWALVAFDSLLVLWLVRAFRRWQNRPARPDAPRPEPRESGTETKDVPLRTPASIDEFEVC